jgi:hypothetical protein
VARHLCLDGIDPLATKHAEKARKAAEAASAVTFRDAASRYIAANRAGWRSAKHAAQWETSLAAYAYPTIGAFPFNAIDGGHITKILEPIWATKPETANRVRGPDREHSGLSNDTPLARGREPSVARAFGKLSAQAMKDASRRPSCRIAVA